METMQRSTRTLGVEAGLSGEVARGQGLGITAVKAFAKSRNDASLPWKENRTLEFTKGATEELLMHPSCDPTLWEAVSDPPRGRLPTLEVGKQSLGHCCIVQTVPSKHVNPSNQ